jgi:tryptophanyl-tRNA synthetase
LPEPLIGATAARIMSLRDGSAKMSKSDPSDMSRINLTDSDDAIAQKFRKAKTDPEPLPDTMDALAQRQEARNLVGIYAALANERGGCACRIRWQGFGQFKPALADLAIAVLSPIRSRLEALRKDPQKSTGYWRAARNALLHLQRRPWKARITRLDCRGVESRIPFA